MRAIVTFMFLCAQCCLACYSAKSPVSVSAFGAKGDGRHDDSAAIEAALKYCIKNKRECFIPRTDHYYNVGSTIRVEIGNSESLVILSDSATLSMNVLPVNKSAYNLTAFDEHVIISIGRKIDSLSTKMFSRSGSSVVKVSGLIIDGKSKVESRVPTTFDKSIVIGMQVLAHSVSIERCLFRNIYGYGLRVHNAKSVGIKSLTFKNVGGRGATMYANKVDRDGFGDAIHISLMKALGRVSITDLNADGMRMRGKRSRCGITFEYSTLPYIINITNSKISGYAKMIHIEETAPANVNIANVKMSDFNIGIANVLNDSSKISMKECILEVGFGDGNEAGDVLAFLNYQSAARIFLEKSTLNFKGKKNAYQSAVGLVSVKDCTINGNNTNLFFADGNTIFERTKFIGFGGRGKSFFSWAGGNSYSLRKCSFARCGPITSENARLSIEY